MSAGGAKRVHNEDPPIWLIAFACVCMGIMCLLGGMIYDNLLPEPKPEVQLWMPLMPKTGAVLSGHVVPSANLLNYNFTALYNSIYRPVLADDEVLSDDHGAGHLLER